MPLLFAILTLSKPSSGTDLILWWLGVSRRLYLYNPHFRSCLPSMRTVESFLTIRNMHYLARGTSPSFIIHQHQKVTAECTLMFTHAKSSRETTKCVYAFTQAHMCIRTHTIPKCRCIPSQHPALRHFSSGLSYKIARETN